MYSGDPVNKYTKHAALLKVMGHPVRLHILDMLRRGETCVCHIERLLGKRQAYISQQLMVLRDAGLVESRKDGLQVFYSLVDEQAAEVLDLLYGAHDSSGLEILEGCTCPACSTVLIAEIG
ncbi:MAG: winged helix-turn-helix transcriptional regulator [Anaerolineaceae bacterium]|nr:winged helix-turn-helix transcriptional regulator [Anaerolineaceae bacterium]